MLGRVQVSFVIPVFNALEFTQACLASLQATLPAGLKHEIVVIDDGSGEETRTFVRGLPPPHIVLVNDRNLGYAASNNRAARVAQGEFLALLNNDLVLSPGWLEPMLTAFARHPRVGVVGNVQLDAATGEVDHAGTIFRDGGYPVHHREPLAELQARGEFVEFPGVTAACCLVRREWFLQSGGFDEGYRNGFEDNDLCMRAREDGLVNLVATRSVVRHHISRSAGRSAHEYRNALRFLTRWGRRTREIETEFALADARGRSVVAARAFFALPLRRLGFGPRALRRHHRTVLAADARARAAATRPLRIGVDLQRLSPGGANGGIKPHLYSFLAEIGRARGAAFNFALIAPPTLREELAAVLRPGDFVLEPAADHYAVSRRVADGWQSGRRIASTDDLPGSAKLDVLYAPFGVSPFMRAGLPCVSLVVDLLHRVVPEALPIEEVNFRHECFRRLATDATWIQCNSHYVIAELEQRYGVLPSRCFHAYVPVHHRLPTPTAVAPADPYFFYPANFWPHKNHETLLLAYRLYAQGAGLRAWPLVLTGQPGPRMKLLEEMRDGLGLGERVRFAGHLDDNAFAVLWAGAGALVFPSLHEGFGIPLLEAMRFGVPIVAAEGGSVPEVTGDAALLVDPRDPRAIADGLRRLTIREGLRQELVARGRTRLGAFSLELEAGRVAHFLEAAARRQTP